MLKPQQNFQAKDETMADNSLNPKPKNLSHRPETTRFSDAYTPDRIRRRAYELFEARGRLSGHELDDWLEAEREIKHHLGLG